MTAKVFSDLSASISFWAAGILAEKTEDVAEKVDQDHRNKKGDDDSRLGPPEGEQVFAQENEDLGHGGGTS